MTSSAPPAQLVVNGRARPIAPADSRESLLRWLQRHGLPGSKEGCGDGDCGACTVALVEHDHDGTPRYTAINSCLTPIGQLAGRQVLTVEALADGDQLHPAQQVLVEAAGSQCGYCTPGIVMSLFVGQQQGLLDDGTTEGNLCRCTGYRPIRAATVALRAQPVAPPAQPPLTALPATPTTCGAIRLPADLDAALACKQAEPHAHWLAGATDLGLELSRRRASAPAFIALDRIAELQALDLGDDTVRIGAGLPLSRIERDLHGLYPALDTLLHLFAARQVRNRATIGGSLGTASPIGDLAPVLLALDATIELAGPGGRRRLPADGFFTGYRQTLRRDDELITAIELPRRAPLNRGYKIAKRQSDDISIVAAAFAIVFDAEQRVDDIRLAYGGVAAMPLRVHAAERMLLGRRLDDDLVADAIDVLQAQLTPLTDVRASADYRRALVGSLFRRFVDEVAA